MSTPHDRIRRARLYLGISQGDLAELVGVSQQHLSRIESKRTKNIDIAPFARALKVPEEWLAFGKNPPHWLSATAQSESTDGESLERLAMAIQVVLDAYITSNPRIDDKSKLAVLQHAPIMSMAKAMRVAMIEQCETAEELKELLNIQ